MKIEVNSPTAIPLPASPAAKQVSNGGVTAAQSASADRTTFHTDSLSVQSLTSQAMSAPEVRQDKVDALRQSVSSGEYQPDATKTASAIVDDNGAGGH
jgi:flagellar biosynthesis anti-sigma factor FlgM